MLEQPTGHLCRYPSLQETKVPRHPLHGTERVRVKALLDDYGVTSNNIHLSELERHNREPTDAQYLQNNRTNDSIARNKQESR